MAALAGEGCRPGEGSKRPALVPPETAKQKTLNPAINTMEACDAGRAMYGLDHCSYIILTQEVPVVIDLKPDSDVDSDAQIRKTSTVDGLGTPAQPITAASCGIG